LARRTPDAAAELRVALTTLEREFGDMQDVEFTIESGKLWILQTRAAKRTPRAALRIAIDLVDEGLIAPNTALRRLNGLEPEDLAKTTLVAVGKPIATGTPASSGVAVGRAAFDCASARRLANDDQVILVRPDISTSDVEGINVSKGVLTASGGRAAHAALVARQLAKPCVVGCSALSVDIPARTARLGDTTLSEGDWLSIDGDAGAIYLGQAQVKTERPEHELAALSAWRAQARHRKDDV
jgi:pyruvate,orthophosphate dikinase